MAATSAIYARIIAALEEANPEFTGNIALKTIEGTAKFISSVIKDGFTSSWLAKIGYILSSFSSFFYLLFSFQPTITYFSFYPLVICFWRTRRFCNAAGCRCKCNIGCVPTYLYLYTLYQCQYFRP
jgi:hypothetical protein